MIEVLTKLLLVGRSRLKSRARLEAENIVLRQQVIVLSRKARSRLRLRNIDRLILAWMYRLFPSILNAITVIKPETVIRWHRRGSLWLLTCLVLESREARKQRASGLANEPSELAGATNPCV